MNNWQPLIDPPDREGELKAQFQYCGLIILFGLFSVAVVIGFVVVFGG